MSRVLWVIILIIFWHSIAYTSRAEFPICTEPGHQGKPDIWGEWVVWHDNREGDNYNIYGKNISSGEEIKISDSNTAFCPSIYDRLVVWQDKRNGNYDIYCYDLMTRTESPLYTVAGDQVNPSIYGDTVVWRTGQYPSWPEIWSYSIPKSKAFMISGAPGNKWEPEIFEDVVVWGDYRNNNWDIYGYNLNSKREFAIATGPAFQRTVAIYGNTVVYENWRSSKNHRIGIYNLNTQKHVYHPTSVDCEWLAIFGTIVVGGDYRNKDTDIYGYKIFTGEDFRISTKIGWQYSPAIYYDTVVWSDDRDGGFNERDIYGAKIPKHLYVDALAFGKNDGLTWADAYNCLQDALTVASSGDDIFIAQGKYKPDQGKNQTLGDRNSTFQLISSVGIYGGFPHGGDKWDNRDLNMYETKLSGDLGGDDEPDFINNDDNSYHIITTSNADEATILDGITVTGGYSAERFGGGMRIENGNPTVRNCTFTRNVAMLGGGLYNYSSSPMLTNCNFYENEAEDGGGIYNYESNLTLTNCAFSRNRARLGGGISDVNSSPTVTNCVFADNIADANGGGVYNDSSSPTLTNCTFNGNTAEGGGGIYGNSGNPVLINCTLSGNSARYGGGICNYDGMIINCNIIGNLARELGGGLYNCDGPISNCIIWNNTAGDQGDQFYQSDAIRYSCVQDISSGQGCISFNPCFVVPGYWDSNGTVDDTNDDFWVDGDYHLKSRAGRWDSLICAELDSTCDAFINLFDFAEFARFWHEKGKSIPSDLDGSGIVNISDLALFLDNYLTSYLLGAWVSDVITSPCIDSGDPNSDYLAELWPHDNRINMGAYGGSNQASMSLSNIGNIADLNNDDTVNFRDFSHFSDSWQINKVPTDEDLNRNNQMNYFDVMIFCDNWLWERGGTINIDLTVEKIWIYQNLPGQINSNLTVHASIRKDPIGNNSYTYIWEFILPSDVNTPLETIAGGNPDNSFWTFAGPNCDESNGLSDSGQVFIIKVTVIGEEHGNIGTAQAEFGIALLGDVNNDSVVDIVDCLIINAFWRTGSSGKFRLRDCDLNYDDIVDVIDYTIAYEVWRGILCRNKVNSPCPFR